MENPGSLGDKRGRGDDESEGKMKQPVSVNEGRGGRGGDGAEEGC
jgi:hypothetical protein